MFEVGWEQPVILIFGALSITNYGEHGAKRHKLDTDSNELLYKQWAEILAELHDSW